VPGLPGIDARASAGPKRRRRHRRADVGPEEQAAADCEVGAERALACRQPFARGLARRTVGLLRAMPFQVGLKPLGCGVDREPALSHRRGLCFFVTRGRGGVRLLPPCRLFVQDGSQRCGDPIGPGTLCAADPLAPGAQGILPGRRFGGNDAVPQVTQRHGAYRSVPGTVGLSGRAPQPGHDLPDPATDSVGGIGGKGVPPWERLPLG
jgi:hypothetical protein